MSLYEEINKRVNKLITKQLSDEELKTSLQGIIQDLEPKQAFHQIDPISVSQPILVYVRLMVQDIRDNCYFYPYFLQKPFSEQSSFHFFKYGHQQEQVPEGIVNNPKFFSYIQDRQTIMCTPVLYETEWFKKLQKNELKSQSYQMVVDKTNLFKLGEIIQVICVYQPKNKLLHFVRKANQSEIKLWQRSEEYLSKNVNLQESNEKLLKIFNSAYSEKYSQFLLYSCISTDHLFISASQNLYYFVSQLFPRVCEVVIKHPFKDSLFPYKNQEEILVQSPMQMSNQHTFVILDFSQFSQEKQVKLSGEELDNLKALKFYVQQGQTVYRWQYGQSQLPHKNTGIIVKASSIIYPQFVIPQSGKKQTEKVNIAQIPQEDLQQLRCYINKVREIDPILKDDREKIQEQIHKQPTKFNEESLVKVMELAKLNARSKGSEQIKLENFQHSCKLFF